MPLFWEVSAIVLYFCALIFIAILSFKKRLTESDFILGSRSLNFWLTAFAAQASDMSNWLFMAYPALIFSFGLDRAWAAIGLIVCMFLNWQLIAPKVRVATEAYGSMTFSSFFENRLGDRSGMIRFFTALMLFVFYTVYISAALVGTGLLLQTLFGLNYQVGVILGILIVVPYVFIGGYLTLAWIDLFQGLFLLLAIVFVPLYLFSDVGGWSAILTAAKTKGIGASLWPQGSFIEILFLTIGWGLGYFGQPHIITKFMGIKHVGHIHKSKYVGMSWMIIALFAATLVGLVGLSFFPGGIDNPEQVFIEMVGKSFSPFLIGLILCAIFATTINAMGSMVLVLSSSLSEDIYKKLKKNASSKELLRVSRMSVIFVSLLAFFIAFRKVNTIYSLVLYAWSGLGASFGPLLFFSLYYKKLNRIGAWSGIIAGGLFVMFWPLMNNFFRLPNYPLPFAFALSCLSIWIGSRITLKDKELENGAA